VTWTLHLGDCLDPVTGLASLADKSVDHVITDPPYEAEAHTLGRRQNPSFTGSGRPTRRVVEDGLTFSAITEGTRNEVCRQAVRICRLSIVVFCQVEAVDAWRKAINTAGGRYLRTIPWIKPDAMPSLHGRWPGQAFEAIVLAKVAPSLKCPVGGKAIWYQYVRKQMARGERPHPTMKPAPLMMDLVKDFTAPGASVLDPFAGSGSTGVACNALGRDFVGWELDGDYHAIASRRLNGDEAKPRPEQPGLFDPAPVRRSPLNECEQCGIRCGDRYICEVCL
jgi:site-specific DNA-methyltransferase (adenine-specific)